MGLKWVLLLALGPSLPLLAAPLPDQFAALELGSITDFSISTNDTDAADWFEYGLLHLVSFG
jgi:hypothetical protein